MAAVTNDTAATRKSLRTNHSPIASTSRTMSVRSNDTMTPMPIKATTGIFHRRAKGELMATMKPRSTSAA